MSILQISKIQQRSGNLVDLPQLDEAEFGWASDVKRLFIGKTTPNENIEVLTSYSQINFSQINGSVGNLNISAVSDGQVLAYDGTDWVNRGGDAGGLITLGDVANVKITGGAIGYVLETDGTGNLAWTPKSTVIAYIQNASKANPAVITTVEDNFFTSAAYVTITGAAGMTQLNGNSFYAKVLTSNTFSLYSDPGLTLTVDSSGYSAYVYSSVTATTISTNAIDVGNAALLTTNTPVRFIGDMSTSGIANNATYYVKTIDTGANTFTISNLLLANGDAGNAVVLSTTTGLTANVYQEGGRAIASVGGGGSGGAAAGSNTTIQINNNNLLAGDADFTFNFGASPKVLAVNGNANIGNLNATGVVSGTRYISNIATGTTPIQVLSTTRVANLNVSYSNVSDFEVVTAQSTGTFYPVFVNGNTTANYALGSNTSLSFNVLTGNLSTALLNVTSDATIGGNLGVGGNIIPNANISYDLGNNTNRFRDLYLSGSSIVLGAQTITSNATSTVFTGNIAGNFFIGDGSQLTSLPSGSGLANGNSNVNIPSANGNVNISAVGNANIVVVTGTGANITGTLKVTGQSNLGANGNVIITGGSASQFLQTDGSGNLSWQTISVGSLSSISNGNSNVSIAASGGNVAISVGGNANILVVTGTGANITGTANVSGNASVSNLLSNGTIGGNTATLFGATLTTGANVTAGTITGNWTLSAGSRLQATYADLAEYYDSDVKYAPGTVLEFGGEKEVTLATDETVKVAGVVSTNPAYVMNSTCPGLPVALALQGRAPCKILGPIKKGDMIVSAGNGYGKSSESPKMGSVIGKALTDFDGAEGVIEVAVGRL